MTATSVGIAHPPPRLTWGRVELRPITDLDRHAWRRLHAHFRDPEIAHLNGTPPSRLPLWLLRRMLRADAARHDRRTFGIFDERAAYIGTVELYDLRGSEATLGIIIGERSHWSRGYGGDAMRALLAYAFEELGLERVRLHTFGDNERAQAAFRKVGFVERQRQTGQRGRVDVHMTLVRSAWFQRRAVPPAPAAGPAQAGSARSASGAPAGHPAAAADATG